MIQFFLRLPIRTKLVSSSVFTLLLIAFFIFTYYPNKQKKLAFRSLEKGVRSTAEMVALGVGVGLGSGNYAAITEAMKWAKNDSALAYIVVLDTTEEQFASYNPTNLVLDQNKLLNQKALVEADGILHTVVPIRYQNVEYGTLLLGVSLAELYSHIHRDKITSLLISLSILVLGVGVTLVFSNMLTKPIIQLRDAANEVAHGNHDVQIELSASDEIGVLGRAFNEMIKNVKRSIIENEKQNWLKTGQAELNDKVRGELDVATLSQNIINYLADYLNAQIGAIYVKDDNSVFKLVGSYAYTKRKHLSNEWQAGEGLVGQAALEKKSILVTQIPDDYIKIRSGLGEQTPRNILVSPFLHEGEVKGVVELGSFAEFSNIQMEFLTLALENIAIIFNSAHSRARMKELLETTQQQAEELQEQQEELRQSNEELEEQTETLKESQAKLEAQQEELKQTNEALESQAKMLEKQKRDINKQNKELQKAQYELEEKARNLQQASKYKSEFLANMSHELRTPLNSLLILSKLLCGNKDGNLTDQQVEFARTIHSAGRDLLNLINDILDLSKVEAGKMELQIESVKLEDLTAGMERNFRYLAKEKAVEFVIAVGDDVPAAIQTDGQRIEQIIRNLLSNAFKFTEKGHVGLKICRPGHDVSFSTDGLDAKNAIAIAVSDTGIGIPKEKLDAIFQAFQQADGSTSRKFGGTGLGLAISREFSKLLGGELQVESEEGVGTTFTLYLPENIESRDHKKEASAARPKIARSEPVAKRDRPSPASKKSKMTKPEVEETDDVLISDDREVISDSDKTILIIEDDCKFAKILIDLTRANGFKCLHAKSGEKGIQLANEYQPSAIMTDIGLPGMDGWGVMRKLKDSPDTRHIPVYFMSASNKTMQAMRMGAIGFLSKPVTMEDLEEALNTIEKTILRTVKQLLVVEDDESQRNSILELIGNGDVETTAVSTGEEAFEKLRSDNFDCMILDLGLSDMTGFELLEKIKRDEAISRLPIIVYTGKDLTREEEHKLRKYAESIIIKGVRSPERLLHEVSLFLHRIEANLPEDKIQMLRNIPGREVNLKDRKILIVDDDMRNIFALTNILEENGMQIVIGKNGIEGLANLERNPDTDLVLMDIMMPEMDGYEAMTEIRKRNEFKELPIIAITAKAMKGDRNKCIEAGANDYLAKPIDSDKLLSLMRVWLHKRARNL